VRGPTAIVPIDFTKHYEFFACTYQGY
jgi:hypothetical protein